MQDLPNNPIMIWNDKSHTQIRRDNHVILFINAGCILICEINYNNVYMNMNYRKWIMLIKFILYTVYINPNSQGEGSYSSVSLTHSILLIIFVYFV